MVDTAPLSGAEGDLARDLIDASSSVTASETPGPGGPVNINLASWTVALLTVLTLLCSRMVLTLIMLV